mgnify:CR=1 FL=1
MPTTIAVVEDDASIRTMLEYYFKSLQYEVAAFETGEDFFHASLRPDLVLLDVMLPGMDGMEILQKLRENADTRDVAVIMLTARSAEMDKVAGLDSGADDYLPKPFDPDELLVRVRAMLRRSDTYRPSILSFGDLTLDPATGDLSCGSSRVRLSGREFQLMELLMRSPGMLFSAEYLMEKVWGWDSEAEINVIWVNISNLRKKIRALGSHTQISASRGLGYLLEAGA